MVLGQERAIQRKTGDGVEDGENFSLRGKLEQREKPQRDLCELALNQ